jgi:hypothetical protein
MRHDLTFDQLQRSDSVRFELRAYGGLPYEARGTVTRRLGLVVEVQTRVRKNPVHITKREFIQGWRFVLDL